MSPERPELPFKMTQVVFQVLLSLAAGDAHAYGIMKDVRERTDGSVKIAPGSLHFTLGKLLDAGLVVEPDEASPRGGHDERRIYYRLTPYGRSVLSSEATFMAEMVELARASNLIPER